MEIYINREGQQYGPYSLDQVQTHLADGMLSDQDYAWADGQADWQLLEAMLAGMPFCGMCQAPLELEQVVCFKCGHNQKTGGATMTTAGVSTAPTGYRPMEPEVVDAQFQLGYTWLAMLLLLGVLFPFYYLDQSFSGEVQTARKMSLPTLDFTNAGWAAWLFKLAPLVAGLVALLLVKVKTLPGNTSPTRGFIVAGLLVLPLVGWFVGDDAINRSPLPFNMLLGGKTGCLFLVGSVLLLLASALRFHRSEHGAAWPVGVMGVLLTAVFWFLPTDTGTWSPSTMPAYGVVASFRGNAPIVLQVISCLGVVCLFGLHVTAAAIFLKRGSLAEPEEQSDAGLRAVWFVALSLAVPAVIALVQHLAEAGLAGFKFQLAWFENRFSFFTALIRDVGLWVGLIALLPLSLADAVIGLYDRGGTSETAKVVFTPDMGAPPSVDPTSTNARRADLRL